jgi:hypothetical protein
MEIQGFELHPTCPAGTARPVWPLFGTAATLFPFRGSAAYYNDRTPCADQDVCSLSTPEVDV